MTPHELNLHIQAYAERMKAESEERLILAYLTAYWQRVKRMPSLKSILQKTEQKKTQTPEQMLAQIKAINAAMGGHIKIKSDREQDK